MTGKDGEFQRLEGPDGAPCAVAGIPPAATARSLPDMEILEHHRKARLQDFGIGEARIGHVGVDGVCSVESRPGRRARADGFVILVFLVAEGQVVHRPLRGRHRAGGAEQAVRHRLTDLDIAGDDGGRIAWRQHRTFRHDDADRPQAAGIHRDVALHQQAEDVENGRPRDGRRRVEIIGTLG